METLPMDQLTEAQRVSHERLRSRFADLTGPFSGPGCVMCRTGNLWIGIEPDGYSHT